MKGDIISEMFVFGAGFKIEESVSDPAPKQPIAEVQRSKIARMSDAEYQQTINRLIAEIKAEPVEPTYTEPTAAEIEAARIKWGI